LIKADQAERKAAAIAAPLSCLTINHVTERSGCEFEL
jgi:hypothetical protein